MAFSAAELQKRHGLEGAPDPFPTLGNGPTPTKPKVPQVSNGSGSSALTGGATAPAPVDTSSEEAFPSLGPSATPSSNISKPAISAWASKPSGVKSSGGGGSGGGSKVKPTAPGGLGRSSGATTLSHPFTDTFSIPANELSTNKMTETLKKVMDQTGAVVESSTQMKTGLKTFLIKASDAKRLAYAKRLIERGLSKPVTIIVEVPITTLGTIIGPKGTTLKGITESTTCQINIPKRDTLPSYEPPSHGHDNNNEDGDEGEDDEPNVPIEITGPGVACQDAKTKILALISHKISTTSVSIKTIPSSYYPFIAGPKGIKVKSMEEQFGNIKIHVPPPAVWKALERSSAAAATGGEDEDTTAPTRDVSIQLRGDKEQVKAAQTEIIKQFEELSENLRELKISIPKRQHRFLVGTSADEILDKTGCIVELPPVEDPSDQCVIRGPQASLIPALTLVMDKANAIAVEMVDLVALHRPAADPLGHAKKVLKYLIRSNSLRSIAESSGGVQIFPPYPSVVATGTVVIEIVGENKSDVIKAKDAVSSAVKAITPSAITTVEIDSLVHALLIGKKGSKIAQFESSHNVTTVFPPQKDESDEVYLVYTGEGLLPSDKKARDNKLSQILGEASKALKELAADAADIKTENLDVEKKFHRYIIGSGGTVLNALIGEDQLVQVKVGKAGDDDTTVVVRGPSGEVDRVVKQIKQIVEDAKNDDIVNGFTIEFGVEKKHVAHLVRKSGESINKLRETLGVKVNFDDDEKKKKVVCKIIGRKEAVEEAKKRLLAQIEKLEDETTEVITIKRAIQPALIGSGGKYAVRLEEKYGVKLSFPRDNKDGTTADEPDKVSIRGGRKGVAAVKAELLEAAAFESESRQTLTFTVPTKAVSQIVGKSGSTINGIKDETGAQIDIDKTPTDGKTSITVRGDKKAIAAAKSAILAVTESIGDEVTIFMKIDPKYHRTLIGQGGNKLKELVANVGGGGGGENQNHNGLINFPRQGDEVVDQVRLRGDKSLVNKIKAELEKQVKILEETKVLGVVVPANQHASKIGRGGSALQDVQRKSGAVIHFPGSRQYSSVGDIENSEELGDSPENDIVKVIGTKEACAKAAELLSINNERPPRTQGGQGNGTPSGTRTPDYATRNVTIQNKYYHAITDQPNLLRSIRNAGGQLTFPTPAPTRPKITKPSSTSDNSAAKEARIDVDDGQNEDGGVESEFVLQENYGPESVSGELEWLLRGKEEDLDKIEEVLMGAVEKAKGATHVGLLTGLPRSAFPRIIGSKGATISRLRAETGADIQVSKDDDLITITGDETSVVQAKDAILEITSRKSRY